MPTPASYTFASGLSANGFGQVATTASINTQLLQAAYAQGLFPWTDLPVGWFCPAFRAVLLPNHIRWPQNLSRLMRRAAFHFSFDRCFEQVMRGCQRAHKDKGEWITDRFVAAYTALHLTGQAHSVEVWQGHELVGGLYGVQVGSCFCAESMFMRVSNASKAALWALQQHSAAVGIQLIDTQVINETTAALGALELPRAEFLLLLAQCREQALPYSGPRWPEKLAMPAR